MSKSTVRKWAEQLNTPNAVKEQATRGYITNLYKKQTKYKDVCT